VVLPLYELSGVLEGCVALTWYELRYYGEPVSLPPLDAVTALSAPLLVLAAYMLAASAYAIRGPERAASELMLGGALAAVSESSLLACLPWVVAREVRAIPVTGPVETSAGLVFFGTARVVETWVLRALLHPAVPLATAAAVLVASLAAWVATLPGEALKGEEAHEDWWEF